MLRHEIIKKNEGITIISLVVTVIILIILAGTSISTLIGEKGIITQAEDAVNKTKRAQIEEQEQINEFIRLFESEEDTKNNINAQKNIKISDLGVGWTLGNSLDCDYEGSGLTIEEYETKWHNPVTTKEMIQAVKAKGFKTILIPVTWFNHVDANNNIDPEWMARVKEVVDYAIDCDMYVIINTHHDDKRLGLEKSEAEFENTIVKYKKIWKQIATTFKDYPSNLIFEVLNEPRAVVNGENVWSPTDVGIYNNLNRLSSELLESIRETGNNNKTRYVLLPTYGTIISEAALNNLELPQDEHIAVAVHGYITYEYCSESYTTFDDTIKETMRYMVQLMSDFSKNKNIPVIFTELGVEKKADRNEWIKNMCFQTAKENIPIIWWDNGSENGSEDRSGYAIFDRNNLKIFDQTAVDALQGYYNKTKNIEQAKNLIDNINTSTNNIEYNTGNMGINQVNGRNRFFLNMNISSTVRFKFLEYYNLNNEDVFEFSCKIKTNMNDLKMRYVMNFYDDANNVIYNVNYYDMSEELVDGSKSEYEFKQYFFIEGAKKVQLERIQVSPSGESQDVDVELYDISLKCK